MAEKTHIQIVPPTKATKETLWLLLGMVFVVAVSSFIVSVNQRDVGNKEALKDYETSVRYDLRPQEQGLVSDLLLAFEELKFVATEGDPAPSVEYWIEENFPPFTDVAEGKARGFHEWSRVELGDARAYLGVSRDLETARHLLWVLPHHPERETLDDFQLWIRDGEEKPPLPRSDDIQDFVKKGWMLVNRVNEIER